MNFKKSGMLEMEPGQRLGFSGAQIGYRTENDPSNVDKIAASGLASNGAHYVRVTAVKPQFLWFSNNCTLPNKHNTATLKVTPCQ
jgi:hypothetical protein